MTGIKNRFAKKSKTPVSAAHAKETIVTPLEKVTSPEKENAKASFKTRARKFFGAIKTAWGRLPKRARLYTILAVALVFIFVVSIVAFTNSRSNSANREQVAGSLKQAKDLEQQVAAAVIFKDFTQAQTLLNQAENILNGIPVDDTTRSEVDALRAALAADKEKLTGSIKVDAPTVLVTIEGKGQPKGLTLIGNKLMVWTADGSVLSVPTGGGEAEALESIERSLGEPTAGVTDESRALVLTARNKLVAVEDGKADELVVAGEFEPGAGATLATYGNRLYVLDPEKKNLQRHNRTVAGYTRGEDWIQDETSLAGTVDLAVDGDLWLLRGTGEVVRMRQGNRQDFTLGQPTETISGATSIVTAEGDTFLYILEPGKKRLMQFEKESGDFVKQYTSESFGQLNDVVVNEKARAAYLLDDTRVIKIDLQS